MSFLVNGFWGELELTVVTTTSPQTFTLPMNAVGYYNARIDWGDGTAFSAITAFNDADLSHSYTTAGTYTLKISGAIGGIRFSNTGDKSLVVSVKYYGATQAFGAFHGCTNLASFDGDLSGILSLENTFAGCTRLNNFPLLNTKTVRNFGQTWLVCPGLTAFPLLNTSSGTNFTGAWYACSGLTAFPSLDVSAGTNFNSAWRQCSGLTTFPLLNVSISTNFFEAWRLCSGMTTFPANMFDDWVGVPVVSCFFNAWANCTSLTAASVENILVSIDASGQPAPSGTNAQREITVDYNVGTGALTANTTTAVASLKVKNWTIKINGVLQ